MYDIFWVIMSVAVNGMTKEHMLSEGAAEEYVDYVIKEIKDFIPKVNITDEIRSKCGYENVELSYSS